jgi:predicted dehydrogenase
MEIARGFAKIPNVCVKTLVDVDENLYAKRVKEIGEIQKFTPSTEYDLRRVFDDKDIDAVAIATPDHWHALATIWACQAGKDVYVEKPCSHNIWEGRKMVEAAHKYNRVVQAGFQNRSIENVRQTIKFLHDGGLGEIYMARGLCFKPRESIGRHPDSPVPKGVHYDLWLGPAPQRPFNKNRFHYEWHWFWDYGSGDIGNQGVHQLDIARWGINKNEHPVKVKSTGGYFAFDSDQQTPNTQIATFEYADGKILQFDVRGLYTNTEDGIANKGRSVGNLFFGTKGWMSIDGSTWRTYFGRDNTPGPFGEAAAKSADPTNLAGAGAGSHYKNFISTMCSGKKDDLNCGIETGHISTALPHLANISYRLGREVIFEGANERFTGDSEADKMLNRDYRKPYVVPEQI